MVKGLMNKQIAAALRISEVMVKVHRGTSCGKSGEDIGRPHQATVRAPHMGYFADTDEHLADKPTAESNT